MKYSFLIITFTFCFVLSTSCEKETIHKLNPDFISYFASSKDGSWWVYSDTVTGTRDSLYVTGYEIKREATGPRSKEYYQIIDYKINFDDKFVHANLNVENDGRSCFTYSRPSHTEEFFIGFPSICKGDSISIHNCPECRYSILESYQINQFDFQDVLQVWNQTDTFYFAKEIGLIQYTVESGGNHQLVNYKIY